MKNLTHIAFVLFFSIVIFPFGNSLMAQNLLVSGITNPAAANGTYVKQSGDKYGFSFWLHTSGNYTVYKHQYDGGDRHYYWNIDNDYDDADVFFYAEADADISPAGLTYTLLSGTGTVVVSEVAVDAEIDIRGNGVSITDGDGTPTFTDFTKFGSANVSGGTLTRSFVIHNTGAADLTLDGSSPYVAISGTNAADFSVTSNPTTPIGAGSSTTFVVTFNPNGAGSRNATLSIDNSDSDEDPYTFDVHGWGYTPKNIVVSGVTNPTAANGTYVHQGTTDRFEYWKHSSENYYIHNEAYSGDQYWYLDIETDGSDDDYLFSKLSDEGTPVGLTGWSAHSPATGTLVIAAATPEPDINLQGNSVTIYDEDNTPTFDDHTNFGSLHISSGSRTRTFTIQNLGSAALTLSGGSPYVAISGSGAAAFSITTPPASSIAGYGNTTFVVTFDPAAEGTRSAVLSIASNDADEATYNFTVEGWGGAGKELLLSGVTSPSAANGVYAYAGISNELEYWKHKTQNYYIYNGFFNDENYWNIDNDRNTSSVYLYSADHKRDASPINVSTWSASSGSGTPEITYNVSEMDVKGNSVSIEDNDDTPSLSDHTAFGSTDVDGGTIVRTFTIENTGGAALELTGSSPYVSVSGSNAGDFSVTTAPASSIASSSSSIFEITFNPSAAGTRTAILSIANNDNDENPYNFSIEGSGTAAIIFKNGADTGLNFQQTHATPPESNWLCGQFSLSGDATGATLNTVTVTLGGTYDSGDLASTPIQLYASNTNNFSGSAALGSSVADPGSGSNVTFSGLSDEIPASTRYYWLTADISASATGDDTMNGTIDAAGDLSITSGIISGSSSYGKLNAGSDVSLPVELSSFSARSQGRSVILEWTTESETNILGFILERSSGGNMYETIVSYQTDDAFKSQGNRSYATDYIFTDRDVEAEASYSYRLKDVSLDGDITIQASLSITVDALPDVTEMAKAYPNPFNSQIYIAYRLAESANVNIFVFDIMGRPVKSLYSGQQLAGSYHVYWNATDNAGGIVPTGIYIIRMQAGSIQQIQKVMLIK